MRNHDGEVLTPAEAAKLLGWSRKKVYGAIERGELPTQRQIRGQRITIPLRTLRMRFADDLEAAAEQTEAGRA